MSIGLERIVVEAGGGRRMPAPFGYELISKIHADQTSGGFSIVELVYPPGNFTPPHRHEKTDEVAYILEGVLGVMVAEEEFQARPGSFAIRPKGVPHALWNNTAQPVRLLDMYTPAGMEAWFEELTRLASPNPPATREQIFEAGRRFDTIFMPELAPPLVQKYNLKLRD
jgi:quercetin dioxygenase-like cupin family protein